MCQGPSRAGAALPAIYPLASMIAADHRLRHLTTLLRVATGRLSWIAKARGGVPYAELQREYDALRGAVAFFEGLHRVRLCVCGKRAHARREEAERHLRALTLISSQGAARLSLLDVYACDEQEGAWHVGHRSRKGIV